MAALESTLELGTGGTAWGWPPVSALCFFGFLLTPLSLIPPVLLPAASAWFTLLLSICLVFAVVPAPLPKKGFFHSAEVVGLGWSLRLWVCSLEPCSAWSLSLVSVPFCSYTPHPSSLSPLPCPPATATSAWEITDTESAASTCSADRGLSAFEGSLVASGPILGPGDSGWGEGRRAGRTGGWKGRG